MLLQIAKFEVKYLLRRPVTYLYFACVFLFGLIAVDFVFEEGLEGKMSNAPYVIAFAMSAVTALFLLVASMVSGASILRDFERGVAELMFVNPISKGDYFFGRFAGSFVVLLVIFVGLPLGMMLGEWLPWREAEALLPFRFWRYLRPFLIQVVPTLFFGSALFFSSAALSRKLLVVYTQGIFLFVAYHIGVVLTQETDHQWLASLIDPFSFRTIRMMTEYWTIDALNDQSVPIAGILLYNRVFWMAMGVVTLAVGYHYFSFSGRERRSKESWKAGAGTPTAPLTSRQELPPVNVVHGLAAETVKAGHAGWFYFRAIIAERSFWAIALCGAAVILINSINLGVAYGVDSYPFTYLVVEELQETSIFLFLIVLVFYAGELVWKEREARAAQVFDSLPVSDLPRLVGKVLGLSLTYGVLLLTLTLAGMGFQLAKGHYALEPSVYLTGFVLELLSFLGLYTIMALFFQTVLNHKYAGHLAIVVFFVAFRFLEAVGYDHGLWKFGGPGLGKYSMMNGYGDSLRVFAWFKTYWFLFVGLVLLVTALLTVRGAEYHLGIRLRMARERMTRPLRLLTLIWASLFLLCGGYIYYNTNVINTYYLPASQEVYRAGYERTLKVYEYVPQPAITAVTLNVELFPATTSYDITGEYRLVNKTETPIGTLHLQKMIDNQVELTTLEVTGGMTIDSLYGKYGYYLGKLSSPLSPGDSLTLRFRQTYTTRGFTQSPSSRIVENGTFFNNDHLLSLGYNHDYELERPQARKAHGLPPQLKSADRNDPLELVKPRSGNTGELIDFNLTIGTAPDQTAIAPGRLLKHWTQDGRNYFHYKTDGPIINFYDIVSARYEVRRKQWVFNKEPKSAAVDLEIYYHKDHSYNLDRMMLAMETSLDYYSEAFGPYPYDHLRIMEFPRYAVFAQSFPGTIPFSEAIGFVMDIDDEREVDMAFYVTAHEVAHQWWGIQLEAANVQGQNMILETLAQYSALMALRRVYPEEKVRQFLQREREIYLKDRVREEAPELPLAEVDDQSHVYYSKGALNMYALQAYLTEGKINQALHQFLTDWNSTDGTLKTKTRRYATTNELLSYFKEVTPDSLRYLVEDLFETVTVHDNRMIGAHSERLSSGQHQVSLQVELTKYRKDSLGKERVVPFNGYFPVAIFAKNKSGKMERVYEKVHRLRDSLNQLTIVIDEVPIKASVDPYGLLIYFDEENNKVGFR